MNIANRTERPSTHPGDLRDPRRPVVALAREHPGAHRYPRHRHLRGQLLYASSGVMTVSSRAGAWVVPPQQAVWIPPGTEHEVGNEGPLAMRSLYVHPGAAQRLPRACSVLNVTPLLRELILRLVAMPEDEQEGDRGLRLAGVILDELEGLEPTPLHLPLPQDPRVRALVDTLLAAPADRRPLAELARGAGASERTLARIFRRETGLSYGEWRRRLRLLGAVSRLARGEPVGVLAYDLGYGSPSAFIAMFRRVLGEPPGRYFRGASEPPGASTSSP